MSRKKLVLALVLAVIAALGVAQAANVRAASQIPESNPLARWSAPNAQGCSGTPTVQYAYANPPTIAPGQISTLYWGLVGNAQAAYLRMPNGQQTGIGTPGSKQVNPTQTSTYYIVAVCGSNSIQVPIVVTVQGGPTCNGLPVIQGFTANPQTITSGQSTTLSWGQVLNATYVQLSSQFEGGSGVPTPGQANVAPSQTTTYYLTAWCNSSTAQAQVTVNVQGAPPTPTPQPPSNANQVRQVQVEKQGSQYKVTVNYYWNGEDAPAVIQTTGYNGSQPVTNSPRTSIIAGFVKYVIQYLNISSPAPNKVTSCIVGSSGTQLACLSVTP